MPAFLIVGVIGIAAICALVVSATLSKLYDDSIDRAKRESAEFAAVLAGQTSRSVEAINLVLEELAQRFGSALGEGDELRARFGDEDTHRYLKLRHSRLPVADVISIADASGQLVNFTRAYPVARLDISDRDHFRAALKSGGKDLVISTPVSNRLSGETIIFFARRIESSTGAFLGVVMVGAQPDKLIDAHAADAHVQGRTLVLVRRDGVLLAHSESPKSAGSTFPATSPWYKLVAAGGGDYRSPGYFDGIARQIVVRPLKNWPLVVNVSQRESAALETWYQIRRTIVFGGSVAGVIALSLITALVLNLRKLAEAQRILWKQAHEDALTVLPNRRVLSEHLDRVVRNSPTHGAIFFIDLDRFKSVNDSLGHAFGDELLQQVAMRLRTLSRKSDVVARIGGDEFVMVAEDADTQSAAALAERIISKINEPFQLREGHQAHIGASVGIRLFSQATDSSEQLIDDADRALYQAKISGRGRYCFHRPEMKAVAQEKLMLDARMRHALACGEFGLVYQPIVDLADDGIKGVEALVRWNDPVHGVVLPGHFIALAEETGFIEPLSSWILDTAFAQMASWRAEGLILETMAVNLGFRHFKSDGFLVEMKDLLAKHNVPAKCITLEITETMAMQDESDVKARLTELCDLGFSIALDDFGTGHSSLSVLRYLPIDKLKIDRSFLSEILSDPIAHNVTSSIISLAKKLGLGVIAEGIERDGQLELMRSLGCDFAQGYLLGRPMPACDISAAVSARRQRFDAVA